MLFMEGSSKYVPQVEYESYEELKEACLSCTQCHLRRGCSQVVFGVGSRDAHLLFVGEGPGEQEDREGIPFVGPAGKLLDRILEAAGIERDEVYITNVVKCRPLKNRTPTLQEMKGCIDYLYQEIEQIKPVIIVPLGAVALKGLLDPGGSIVRMQGEWLKREGYYFLPTYHPAALLHDERKKRPVWMDFLKIKRASKRYQEILRKGEELP